jgi:hypothetical protein
MMVFHIFECLSDLEKFLFHQNLLYVATVLQNNKSNPVRCHLDYFDGRIQARLIFPLHFLLRC